VSLLFTVVMITSKLIVLSPLCLLSISNNLLRSRTDPEATRMWTASIYRLLQIYAMNSTVCDVSRCRPPFPLTVVVCFQLDHVKAIQNDPARTPAFVLLEVALLVTLTSADTHVSYVAAKCLRHLAYLESVPGAPPAPIDDDELLSKRHLVYEQLGDPRVMIVGMCTSTTFHRRD
jgi:neurofibromin 1